MTMNHVKFIRDFAALGDLLQDHVSDTKNIPALDQAITCSLEANPWFTGYHIKERLSSIAQYYLSASRLEAWLADYQDVWHDGHHDITVVMAGNIPLVGYHDYLSVLASGRRVSVKCSSKDAFLLPALHQLLCSFAPKWLSQVRFVEEIPDDSDGLIATGSDATAAWFKEHYPQLPKIIRGHRNSVAVLTEDITREQIACLHRDMFDFFGLGCRSVVHLFIPKGFDLKRITAFDQWPKEAEHQGFQNAYRHQKALLSLQQIPFVDGGFFLLQAEEGLSPPVATFFYTIYTRINEIIDYLESNKSLLQIVVGTTRMIKNCINFGCSQNPSLYDTSI